MQDADAAANYELSGIIHYKIIIYTVLDLKFTWLYLARYYQF